MEKHPPHANGWLHWLPQPPGIDLLVFGFIFVLISFILPLHDPDFYWHIKSGEYIFSTRSLPTTDIFSFTMQDQPWVLHEWLSQLVLYWTYSWFGFPGIRILTAALFTLSFYIINRLSYALNTNLFHTTMLTGVFLILSLPSCSPRPQLFTFLFLAIFVYALFRLKYENDKRYLLVLPMVMVLWANSHGGYFIGLILIGILWFSELVQVYFSRSSGGLPSGYFRALSLTLVATLLASLLTPYTYHLWLYPFEVMQMEATKVFISEWQSPDFHQLRYQAFLATMMIYGALLVYSNRKPGMAEALLSGAFIFFGFLAIRNIPLTLIVIGPLFALFARLIDVGNTSLNVANNAPSTLQKSRANVQNTLSESNLTNSQSNLAGWVFFSLLLAISVIIYRQQPSPDIKLNAALPVAAVQFIKEHNISGRVFNKYGYGGYLIFEFYPDQKVFIDGRADMYGDDFVKEYTSIYNGNNNWKELFDKHSIDIALVGLSAPITQILRLSGEFILVHEDNSHALLVRDTPKYQQIIELYGK